MSPQTPIIPGQAGLLIPPYGGTLVDLVAKDEERNHLVKRAETLPSLRLSTRALCDLEILAIGGFSPLDRFMRKADYVRTLAEMRLADGTPFPIPITLPAILPAGTGIGSEIVLRSPNNETVAVMLVDEIFERDYVEEPQQVCGTIDVHHPLVAEMASWPRWYVSGSLRVFRLPNHYDFSNIRQSPAAVRIVLERLGHKNVVAFQTRNPIHRAHEELTKLAMEKVNGTLLIQPTVGVTNPGDVDHFTRTRTYQVLVERYYDQKRTVLNLLPLAMRMAGPREAVWHAIIRRNYGANHFIVGRDHASPGVDSVGRPFYETYAAQELLAKFRHEIGITPVPFKEFVYLPHEDRYAERDGVNASAKAVSLSGTEVRLEYLRNGKKLPEWFTRPETAAILARSSPPLHRQGFCVWFTGLSGAGKSTTAEILAVLLMEHGRQVTVLDGDVVRTRLSRGLGFSKEDRDDNIRRIGFVASEVVRHHGAVICATISPYRSTRNEVRAMVGAHRFIEIFVDTPLEVCELRDVKGMYAKARRGQLPGFTGIDDPYEPPVNPEIRLTTTECLPENNARWIVRYLIDRGFLLNHEDERNFS